MSNAEFANVLKLVERARDNAFRAVNTEIISLYWNVGEYLSMQMNHAGWGDKTVQDLAGYLRHTGKGVKGFDRRSLYRMKQFYELYSQLPLVKEKLQVAENQIFEIVAALRPQFQMTDIRQTIVAELSWTHHRTIFSRCSSPDEIAFYLNMCVREQYTSRQLERQISAGLFERSLQGLPAASAALNNTYPGMTSLFKDSYVFEFLKLPESYSEADIQKALVRQMKHFIMELGRDFLFLGEEYPVKVGNTDFYIDMLFYHRGLQCLVAIELKSDKFKPEHIGKLNFYLEALDRDVKKEHENPSIGMLLCKDKDAAVVEYSLCRSLSPAMVAAYKVQLPDKEMLQQQLRLLYDRQQT